MPRSNVEVVVSFFVPEVKTVTERTKVRKLVNGRYQTVYETRTVKKKVNTRYSRVLPVTPEEIQVTWGRDFNDSATLANRTYTAPGAVKPLEIRLDSFFTGDRGASYIQRPLVEDPVKSANWYRDRLLNTDYVVRVEIRALNIGAFMHLREFNFNTEGGTYDLPYTMVFRERGMPGVTVKNL
ncbi:hypothetical protein PJK55_14510 [Exiguobacterium sp. MMG028]|uniref:hypothetical protein n=1 Tax=Exiguobacterium sp. MMG028 TaxID=3021979 RepID=UPI0022FE3C2A|nr:hypothetical protein [Exiguobacterium sp. MMG028]MDA5561948.1 hypothetical protein [Exiguobacterium sp. MMG028]